MPLAFFNSLIFQSLHSRNINYINKNPAPTPPYYEVINNILYNVSKKHPTILIDIIDIIDIGRYYKPKVVHLS